MKLSKNAQLLRIYLDKNLKYKNKPMYEQIVLKAKELKLAGATVLRGIMGFGAESHLHTAKLLSLSEGLPVVVEIVDSEENINKLLPYIDENLKEGLVTIEKVRVYKYC
ncbi:MAG: DUF190 domain-containing protein [Candidatus Cloacimonadota bacterium]|nr:MAG: DUF190 domain-containing protein [Candidatus Cloacimonadota bacterium]